MSRRIDTQGETDNVRLTEQAGNVVAVDAGYWHLFCKEGGLYVEDDNEVALGPLGSSFEPGGRLTLTTATPVTTADVTAAATLYYTPYKHNMISLYDGARWIPVLFTEKSLSLVGYTASKPYDIFGVLSSNTLALESLIWTDGTTRATALTYQDGRLVKNGAATRLYLGTIYINSSGAQTDDSVTKRFVWNYYNRNRRYLYIEDLNAHNYGTAAWRSWNNNAALRLEVMVGVSEELLSMSHLVQMETSYTSIGYDVTNASLGGRWELFEAGTVLTRTGLSSYHLTGVGYHFYQLLEYGSAAGATQSYFWVSGYILG